MNNKFEMDIRSFKKSYKAVDQPAPLTQKIGIHNLPTEILEQIFYYLRLPDLLNCRLVHPSWRKSATKPCRDKTTEIRFGGHDDVHHALLLRDLMCLLNKSADIQSFPTASLRVGIGLIRNKCEPQNKKLSANEITNFFNTIASFVTEITVVILLGSRTERYYKFLQKDLTFQRLKCLTLCVRNYVDVSNDDDDDIADDEKEEEKRCLMNFLRGVVENAEALSQITLKIGDQEGTPATAIRMCVEECGMRSKLKFLTHLKIKVNVARVDWVTLSNMGLKLQKLSILLKETTEGHADSLKGFLNSQADTLTALEISHEPRIIFDNDVEAIYHLTKCSIGFPSMTRLESLEIISEAYKDVEEDEPVDFGIFEILDFSYMKQFPALKELNLKAVKVIWPCFLGYHRVPLDTLEELILSEYCNDENSIIDAALSFPNIKKLHVTAEENMLLAVYEHMNKLEDLTLYTSAEIPMDDIISGVDPAEFRNVVGPRVAKVNAWRRLLRSSTRKSMDCLENLKVLRLKTEWSHSEEYVKNMLEFGDISVLVFREMQSLKCLDLGVRQFSNLNNELALLEDLRKTLDVFITRKKEKLHRKERKVF